MRVPRHKVNAGLVDERFREALESQPEYLRAACRNPDNLTLLISNALDVARCGSIVAVGDTEIVKSLRLAAQASAALFAIAASKGGVVRVPLGEESILYSNVIDESMVYPQRWIQGFFLSSLCRDELSTELLCQSSHALLALSSTKEPEYRHLFADSLTSFHLGEVDTAKLIIGALKATDPDRMDIRKPEWTLMIDIPLMELLFYVWTGDKEFGDAIAKSIQLHKDYWSKTKSRRQDWDGFLPIGLLSMAALANDRNIPFDIDTDYLPPSIFRNRSSLGE